MSGENTLLHPVNELHFGSYRPEDVPEALETIIADSHQQILAIEEIPEGDRTYENTVQAMHDATDRLANFKALVDNMDAAMGGAWADENEKVTERSATFFIELEQNTALYQAVKSIQDRQAELNLTEPQIRALAAEVTEFERSGINLDPETKERLAAVKQELAELENTFSKNEDKAEDTAYLYVDSKDKLAGVPEDVLEKWSEEAKKRHFLDGYAIDYNSPNYCAIMVGCAAEKTRREMYELARTLAPENEAVAERMLALRKEYAQLLGYDSYADYATETRMAKTGARASEFIDDLTERLLPGLERETTELEAYIGKLLGTEYKLDITDVDSGIDLHYAEKMRAELLGSEADISEYLPFDHVKMVMLSIAETLYKVQFRPSSEEVYHEDVEPYDILNKQGQHIATIWCDWFARKNKSGGAWVDTLYVADRANGKVDEPHKIVMMADFAPPTKEKPSLLSLENVRTALHEFLGHGMHMALSRTELRQHHGQHTKRDFVEALSQIKENLLWQDVVLRMMTKHYNTGKALPEETINNLRKQESFRCASKLLWTLYWSDVDLFLHSEYDPRKHGTVNEAARMRKQRYVAAPVADFDSGINTYSHIFAGGYAAGYYGYPWAEARGHDMFEVFKAAGVLSQHVGEDFDVKVLARGDEDEPETLIEDFLQRPYTLDAMLRKYGIAAA